MHDSICNESGRCVEWSMTGHNSYNTESIFYNLKITNTMKMVTFTENGKILMNEQIKTLKIINKSLKEIN